MFVAVVAAGCDKSEDAPVKYTVTFKVDGVVVSTKTVEKASELVVPANPTKAGYTFKHWALDGATTKYNLASELTASITLVAIFEQDEVETTVFTVTFVVEGEDDVLVEVEDGEKVARPDDPVKDGYEFTDWFVGEEGSEVAYDFDEPVTADLTLTAKFEEIVIATHQVSFSVDGSVTGTEVNDGDPVARPDDPEKDGHVFVEWQLNGATYNFGAPVRADITLTAVFAVAVTVKFQIDSNIIQEVIAINTPVNRPADPVKDDFVFDNWYVGEDVYDFSEPVTADITITAQFIAAVTYSITYELNGGTNGDNPETHKNTTALVLKDATKEGAAFVGWFTTVDFSGDAVAEIAVGNTEDVTLYAKWDSSANATFVLNEGSLALEDVIAFRESTYIKTNRYNMTDWSGKDIYVGSNKTGAYWPTMAFKTTDNAGIYELVEKALSKDINATGIALYVSYHGDCASEYKDTIQGIYTDIAAGALVAITGIPAEATTTANIEMYFIAADALTANVSLKIEENDELIAPVREGYKFLGWCTKADLSDEPIFTYVGGAGGEDITYYAKWGAAKKITYVIPFPNAGNNNPELIVEADLPLDLQDIDYNGYTFDGWFATEEGGDPIPQITKFEDVTLYARFTGRTYNITYVLNEGTNHEDNPPTYQTGVGVASFYDATRDGYRFLGWYSVLDVKITSLPTNQAGDVTLTAKWEELVTANITYHLDGGTNHEDNPSQFEETDLTITLQNATKDGHYFDGWFDAAEGGTKVTVIDEFRDYELYAIFYIIAYDINYEGITGATNPDSNPTDYTINTATITFAPATKDGYIFLGWFTAAEGGTKVTQIEKGSMGEVTVYAQWQIISTYNLTYHTNGATGANTNPESHSNDTALVLVALEKTGFNFTGWYDNAELTGAPITGYPIGHTGDVELWAGWIAPFTITYNLDGGHWGYATREDMVNDFLDDYTAFYNAVVPASLGRMTLLRDGDTGYSGSTAYVGRTGGWGTTAPAILGNFFNHANYKDKWMWMIEYLKPLAPANQDQFDSILNNTHGTNATSQVRWETWGFLAGRKDASVSIADYTVTETANGFWATAFQDTEFTYQYALTTMPTLYKEGYTFVGWFDAETGGNQVTSASADATLYARFAPDTE
jgi:uncharacterized repeat protein (TIGR02543 family)